jgi:hypothetical protein
LRALREVLQSMLREYFGMVAEPKCNNLGLFRRMMFKPEVHDAAWARFQRVSKPWGRMLFHVKRALRTRIPVLYFWFTGWDHISFGVSVCTSLPNLEVHLPFGFIRVGLSKRFPEDKASWLPSVRRASPGHPNFGAGWGV